MNHLGFLNLKLLSQRLAEEFKLTINPVAFWQMYFDNKLPLIIDNDRVRLWIDRHYLAYQETNGQPTYVYISRTHIEEELESYRELKCTRRKAATLPPEIQFQFSKALAYMDNVRSSMWFAPLDLKKSAKIA